MSNRHKGKSYSSAVGNAAQDLGGQGSPPVAKPSSATPGEASAPSDRPVLHLVRVTIETESPLALGSGDIAIAERKERDNGVETVTSLKEVSLPRDAYGLPTIPGGTLQGILRHLCDDDSTEFRRVFGWASGDSGEAAMLQVGFGRVHDVFDRAIDGLVPDETRAAAILADPILSELGRSAPIRRDHAKLNARHVVDGRAKFTRLAVPVGARFSFEMALWSEAAVAGEDGAYLCRVAGLLAHPAFRIGGGGRRGYGRVKIVRASYVRPKLETLQDLRALRELRRQPPSEHFAARFTPSSESRGAVVAQLHLRPINPWRIGRGDVPATELTHGVRDSNGRWTRDADIDPRGARTPSQQGQPDAPVARDSLDVVTLARESWIDRRDGRPTWRRPIADASFASSPFAVPGSALKGPLAHRTLFHWNRANSRFIDVNAWLALDKETRGRKLEECALRPLELSGLLGSPKERQQTDARASRLIVDDGVVANARAIQGLDHNSIDRFTGGVREGFLYAEEMLVGGEISTRLVILPPLEADGWPADVRDAFVAALADLCDGRLAIGAKSLGFCEGTVEWAGDDASVWQEAWRTTSSARGEERAS